MAYTTGNQNGLPYWKDENGNITFGEPPAGAAPATMQPQAPPTTAPKVDYAALLQQTLAGLQGPYGAQQQAGYGGGFNAAQYLAMNPDVARAIQAGTVPSALSHFQQFGQAEGRAPNGQMNYMAGRGRPGLNYGAGLNRFQLNTPYYLQQNPDVAQAVQNGVMPNAWTHYASFGQREGRAAQPPTTMYGQPMPNGYRPMGLLGRR